MNLKEGPVVTVHTEHKIKRKRKSGGGIVSIAAEPEGKMYRISFFKRRRLSNETSVPFEYKRGTDKPPTHLDCRDVSRSEHIPPPHV